MDARNEPLVRSRLRGAATVWCALVLLALHFVGGFFILNALLTASEGPWDTGVTQTVRMTAVFGIVTEALAAGVTAAFVALAGLRKWWYAIPAALIVTATVRVIFAPET